MKQCAKCGAQVAPDGKFCPKCGSTDFIFSETSENAPSEAKSDKNIQNNKKVDKSMPANGRESIMTKMVVLVVILALCGVGAYFLFLRNGNEDSDNVETVTSIIEEMVESSNVIESDGINEDRNQESDKEKQPSEDIIGETTETATSEQVKDEQIIDLTSFIGYWDMSGDQERELTIKSVDDNQLVFSLWYYRLASIDDVVAVIEGNKAVFSINSYGETIAGNLIFEDNSVNVNIIRSDMLYMPAENMVFDNRHYDSWSGDRIGEDPWQDTYEQSSGDYILPQSDRVLLSNADLIGLSKDELRLARNEIYARHGRLFTSEDLQAYFDKQSWYYGYIPAGQFSESLLNEVERANVNTIKAYENALNSP